VAQRNLGPAAPDAPDYCCLTNLSFTVNYNLSESVENNVVFCCIVHHNLFQYIKIIPPHTSCPGKAGSSKQPLIQQIVHAAFDPLGGEAAFSLR
jgi:hypothetical protein